MKIGIYVGSFNPIHKGHIKIVNYLITHKYVDKIIIIPTCNYWDKQDLVDLLHRINMVKFYENEYIYVDDKLNKLPYTIQILNELKKVYKEHELNLIIGDDNLEKFYLWKNVDDILKNNIIVIPRNNGYKKYINKYKEKSKFIFVEDFQIENISSTLIRKCIKGNNLKDVLRYIDEDILNYIIENGLYSE